MGGGLHLEINFPSPSRHYMGANAPQWKGQDRTQDRAQIPVFPKGRGGRLHLEINFPSPGRHYMGANAPRWKGQDRTQDRTQIPVFSKGGGGGGGVTPRNKFPIPEQTLYGCKCAKVETQHYTNVRQIPGGGGVVMGNHKH